MIIECFIIKMSMTWYSKTPPKHVWRGDRWFNETEQCFYTAKVTKLIWCADIPYQKPNIPFPPQTIIYLTKNPECGAGEQ